MNYLNNTENQSINTVVALNTLLADYHIYYQKLRNYHWNVLGKNFFELHAKFEELYTDARIKIDEIAERILTLRFHPISNFSEYLKISSLSESDSKIKDIRMVAELLNDHSIILAQMREVLEHANKVSDEGTIDMMGSYIRELEKSSWMLNAWLKQGSEKFNSTEVEA